MSDLYKSSIKLDSKGLPIPPRTQDELCDYIVDYAEMIYVRGRVSTCANGHKTYGTIDTCPICSDKSIKVKMDNVTLSEMSVRDALITAFNCIKQGFVPAILLPAKKSELCKAVQNKTDENPTSLNAGKRSETQASHHARKRSGSAPGDGKASRDESAPGDESATIDEVKKNILAAWKDSD